MTARKHAADEKPTAYVVVGFLADGVTADGQGVTLYQGAPVRDDITTESVAHLLSVGLIAPVEASEA